MADNSSTSADARAIALDLLRTVLGQRRPLDDALAAHPGLSALEPRDRAFTRLRSEVRPTQFSLVAVAAALMWAAASVISGQIWAMTLAAFLCGLILYRMIQSRRRCLKAVTRLVINAGRVVKLSPVVFGEHHAGATVGETESDAAEIAAGHGLDTEEFQIDSGSSHELRT